MSNSSSSSFIVAAEDNVYRVLLHDPRKLSLSEYVEEFLWRDIFYDSWHLEKNVKFVSNQEFSRLFKEDKLDNVLPESAKDLYDDYIKIQDSKDECLNNHKFDDAEYKKYYATIELMKNNILKRCLAALKLKWKSVVFHYQEVDDNYENGDEDEDGCMNAEDRTRERIAYVENLRHGLKFYRKFCNH